MSRGKYSPHLPNANKGPDYFKYNCYGKIPAEWTPEIEAAGIVYDAKTMLGMYDEEGFDGYGYSSFDADGNYDFGSGIDRAGYTETQYFLMYEYEEYGQYNDDDLN